MVDFAAAVAAVIVGLFGLVAVVNDDGKVNVNTLIDLIVLKQNRII